PGSSLCPYTTLFRSVSRKRQALPVGRGLGLRRERQRMQAGESRTQGTVARGFLRQSGGQAGGLVGREDRQRGLGDGRGADRPALDRKSTRLNSSHVK